jgi:hypothetical protein
MRHDVASGIETKRVGVAQRLPPHNSQRPRPPGEFLVEPALTGELPVSNREPWTLNLEQRAN